MLRHLLYVTAFCLSACIAFGQDSTAKSFLLKFQGYTTKLSNEATFTLDSVVRIMKEQPDYKCMTINQCVTENPKFSAAQWDRLNVVANYLIKKQGVNQDRIIFRFTDDGNEDDYNGNKIIVLLSNVRQTQLSLPHPHPNLRRIKRDSLQSINKPCYLNLILSYHLIGVPYIPDPYRMSKDATTAC